MKPGGSRSRSEADISCDIIYDVLFVTAVDPNDVYKSACQCEALEEILAVHWFEIGKSKKVLIIKKSNCSTELSA